MLKINRLHSFLALVLVLVASNVSAQNNKFHFLESCSALLTHCKPKIGCPSSIHPDFHLWVISYKQGKAKDSKALNDRMSNIILTTQSIYAENGFHFSYPLNVLVELHEGAVQSEWSDSIINLNRADVQIPIFGAYLSFRDLVQDKDPKKENRAMYITGKVINAENKNLVRQVVAHELAHVTEPKKSSSSRMWNEARADYLAYVATGIPTLIVQGSKGIARRSLDYPSITCFEDLVLDLNQYHKNSEVISHVLYRLEQKFGRKDALEFIRWVDNNGNIIQENQIQTMILRFFGALVLWVEENRLEDEAYFNWIDEELYRVRK